MIDLDLSYYFSAFKNKSGNVKSVVDSAINTYHMDHADSLGGQLFNALYQKTPRLISVEDPNNKYSQAVRAVLKSGQFLALRNQTAGNLAWSAIGASILVDELAKKIDWSEEKKPEPKDPEPIVCGGLGGDDNIGQSKGEDGESQESKSSSEENKSSDGNKEDEEPSEDNNGEDSGDENSDENPSDDSEDNKSEDGEEDGKDRTSQEEETKSETESESEEGDSNDEDGSEEGEPNLQSDRPLDEQRSEPVDIDIQQAVNQAGEKLGDILTGMSPGAGDSIETFNDSIDMAELYTGLSSNQDLSELIQLVGKLRLNTSFLPAMAIGEPEEVSDVELGNELEKVLPSDMGLMFGSDEEFFHFMRMHENKELTQYQTVTHKTPGAGPMVVCVDDSGSMISGLAGSDHTREQWAKSLAIAIYIQALKEHRPYAAVKFGTYANLHKPKTLNKLDPDFLNALQNSNAGGGTDFQVAWNKAIEFITEGDREFRDADVIYITDGMGAYDADTVIRTKEDNNIRLVTIFLGAGKSRNAGYVGGWAQLSDAMVFVDRLSDKTEAEAFKIIKNHELNGIRTV